MGSAPSARLSTLHDVALALSSELDRRRLVEGIVHGVRRLLDVPFAAVAFWDQGREELVIEATSGAEPPGASAFADDLPVTMGRAFHERRTVVVDDLAARARASQRERGPGLAAVLASPLPQREGGAAGVLVAAHLERGRRFEAEEVRLLEILGGHVALALGNAETFASAARRLARVEELANALRGIIETRRRDLVLDRALDCATTILGADRAAIYLIERGPEVSAVAGRRLSRAYLEAVARDYRRSAGGLLPFTRAPIYVADVASDPRTRPLHALAESEGIHSMLLLPLLYRDELLGALALYHDLVWRYGAEDIAPARALADQIALALGDAALHEKTERQLAQLRVLEALVRAIGEPVATVERCQRGVTAMVARGGAASAWVLLLDGGELQVAARAGVSALADRVIVEAGEAALAAAGPVTSAVPGADALVAAPIVPGAGDARPLGALVIAPPRPITFEPRPATTILHLGAQESPETHREFVGTAAGQLGAAIVNARLLEQSVALGLRLGTVVDALPDAILVFDRDDRIVLFNRKVLEIYGIEGRDITGWTPEDFIREIGHCFADPAVPREIARNVHERKPQPTRLEFELSRPRRRIIERTSAPLRLPDGEPAGQVVLYHDLTDVRDAQRALERSREAGRAEP